MSAAPAGTSTIDVPAAVARTLAELGYGRAISAVPLRGGIISLTRRLTTDTGATVVLKTRADAPSQLYRSEALGLAALAGLPGLVVPRVLLVRAECILLEDLGPQPSDEVVPDVGDAYWDAFGRGLAHLHGRIGSRHGCGFESWWGLMRMDNEWTADGWEFFARTRLLWFLARPGVEATLTAEDRRGVERVAANLRELVPPQPASLCHGDLWAGNRAVTRDGRPAMLDPFVHYGWPEAELANCRMFGGFAERFYEAYVESHPLESGWRRRLELYYLPHLLGMIDHGYRDYVGWLRAVIARFG